MSIEIWDPTASRTVRPKRTPKACTLPIVALTPDFALSESTGAVVSFDEYCDSLYSHPRTIVVTYGAETLLWKLHQKWKDHPRWSWRVSTTEAHGKPLLNKRVNYWGFRDKSKRSNKLHIILDANSFFRRNDKQPSELLQLGKEVRDFCNAHQLEVRASAAGLAAQLLRHPMFYPFARRQVPDFINEAVRPYLPGGHYEMYADVGQRMETTTYIDQESAHHYAAMTTPLPNANSVRAQGYERYESRAWARKGGALYKKALQSHGLVRAAIKVPPLTRTSYTVETGKVSKGSSSFVPRVMQTPGERIAHLWTNEIPYLEKMGLEIQHLVCVWGTEEVDNGLAKYAQWAHEQSKRHPQLKAMLLMPYGLLARHPGQSTLHHPGGEEPLILANQYLSDTFAKTCNTKPVTANALQLGLIQSFVRSLSLDMAKQLNDDGHEVVSIYADGVFVKLTESKQLPIFAPWRIKEEALEIEVREASRVPRIGRLERNYALVK